MSQLDTGEWIRLRTLTQKQNKTEAEMQELTELVAKQYGMRDSSKSV